MSVTNLYPRYNSSFTNWNKWTATGESLYGQDCYSYTTTKGEQYPLYIAIACSTKTYTYSVYVKSNVANRQITICFHDTTTFDRSGYEAVSATGESPVINYESKYCSYTLPLANTWYRLSFTVLFSTARNGYPRVQSPTNGTLTIAAPMLEVGNTPSEFIPYGGWAFHAAEGEYPINDQAMPVLQNGFTEPLPTNRWRIDESNGCYPYHMLMPDILYAEPEPPPPPEPEPDAPIVVQYDIYCDDKLMHSSISPDNAFKVIDPVLDLQDSAAGSLEFGLPPFNTMYGQMLMVASTIRVERNGEEIWEGRPVSFKEDMWLNHNVTCEGELAYLNDVYQVQAKYENVTLTQLLWAVIGVNENGIDITKGYNQRAAANRRFDIGSITAPKYEVDTLTFTVPFDSTLNVVNSICKEYGLHVYVEKHDGVRTLIFTGEDSPRGENNTQKIEFGTNLIDYAKSYNFAELVTAVLPLGAKSDKAGKVVIAKDEHGVNIEMTPTPIGSNNGRGYVIWPSDDENHNAGDIVDVSSADDGNRYFVYKYTVTKDKATVFITAQNNNGFGMSCVKYLGSSVYYLKKAKNGSSMTVWTETKYPAWYNMFADDATIDIYVGGYDSTSTSGVPTGIAVYESKVVDEGMEDYTTVESVNYWYDSDNQRQNDGYWVIDHESNTIDIYGRIERKVEWNSVKDAQTLYNNAIEYLRSGQFDGMQITLTAFDMAILGAKNTNVLRVGENVHCIAPPYGLDSLMPITEIKIPLSKPEDTKFTVGDKRKQNLTSVNSSTNSELLAMIAEKPSVSAVLSAAKRSAAEYITDTRNSYVTYRYGTNGETQAIIISDSEDYTQSTNGYWIFGDHGIGYVRAGHSEETDYTDATVAMTKDGRIVADYIVAGLMLADRIRGGTLNLGHWPVGNFTSLTTRPGDWSTNYYSYYYYSDVTKEYKHVEAVNGGAPDPAPGDWPTDKYFSTNSSTTYVEGLLKIMGKINSNPLLQFGRESDSTGKYKHGLEVFSSTDSEDNPFTNQNYGQWLCLTNGNICFGHHDGETIDDGVSWDDRPRIYGAVPFADEGYKSIAIQVPSPGSLFFNVPKFRVYGSLTAEGSSPVTTYWSARTGDDYIQVRNQKLVFLKGILMDVRSASADALYSGNFVIGNTRYLVNDGLITGTEQVEQNNNE